jgi:hypothetical protein
MQEFPDLVAALSHHLKPLVRDGSQFALMFFHPGIDGGIALDSAVESQEVGSVRLYTFLFPRSLVTEHPHLCLQSNSWSETIVLVEEVWRPLTPGLL